VKPGYIPPVCQGRPVSRVSSSEVSQKPAVSIKRNPPISKGQQLAIFYKLSNAIETMYIDPDFNGRYWPRVVDPIRTKIEEGLDTEAFYKEMSDLVKSLGDDHSYFLTPAQELEDKSRIDDSSNFVGLGAFMRPIAASKVVSIVAVFPDSPAERNGLKMHDRVLAVDGIPLIENGIVYQQRAFGPECSSAVFTVQTPGGPIRNISIVRYRTSAPLRVEYRLVPTKDGSRIGYVFIPSFLDDTVPDQMKKALESFGELDGLIIDNRMNGGGASSVLIPTLSFFASGTVGNFVSRNAKRPLEISAKPVRNSQSVPLVVLIGKDTVSYGEVFAGVLQDLGRARIVGETSKGNVETLRGHNFPDGSQAWIAQERFEPIRSKVGWEKRGVKPDVEAHAEWDTFTFETDPGVAAAVRSLRSN
jgi:carboxyl-terminal processing protease